MTINDAQAVAAPPVPLTVEGASVLHQMMRVRWPAWNTLSAERRAGAVAEAAAVLDEMGGGRTALYSLIGHKGDLMLVHFRDDFAALNDAELRLARLRLWEY